MKATATELRTEAEAKARATALRCTREAVCPVCGQPAKLHIEAQEYTGRDERDSLAASAVATWECCGQVGRAFREVVRA